MVIYNNSIINTMPCFILTSIGDMIKCKWDNYMELLISFVRV